MIRILAAMALACAGSFGISCPASADLRYPHLERPVAAAETAQERPKAVSARGKARTAAAAASRPRSGAADAVSVAERYLGTNPTKMRRLWCANFMGLIEKKVGRKGTGSNMARSYDSYGRKVSRSEVRRGDIAVMSRGKRGGHVGYFVEWARNGKAVIISGNSRGGRVSKGQYALGRIYAWRRPA